MSWTCKNCGAQNEDNYISCSECLNYYNSDSTALFEVIEYRPTAYNYIPVQELSRKIIKFNKFNSIFLFIISSVINIAFISYFPLAILYDSELPQFRGNELFSMIISNAAKNFSVKLLIIYFSALFAWSFLMNKFSKRCTFNPIIPTIAVCSIFTFAVIFPIDISILIYIVNLLKKS